MKHTVAANDVLKSKKVTKLGDNLFLIPVESHSSDDYYSCYYWYGDNKFEFSANIKVVAATYIFSGGAVVVQKVDPNIPEVIKISDPNGPVISITF